MSAKKNRCYSLILEKVGNKQFPSKMEILNFLHNQDFHIAERTLERYFQKIRNEFGVSIAYNSFKNGYYINEEESGDMEGFFRFLEIVNTAELLTESLVESKDSLKHISFDAQGSFKGMEHLKILLEAIKSHRRVTFLHENFETGKARKYSIKPYLIKEYQNRWYPVGMISGIDEFRTFGIDRIKNLEMTDKTFAPRKNFDPATLFSNTIGLTYSFNKLEEILLSFTPLQGKYVKALPLHVSQQIVLDDENEVRIKLRIIPNFEFTQRILMLGSAVKVIEPKWLADEIKRNLKEALKNYSK